ncbi:MAG: glycosyltransferase [Bacteroidetes bacterium]|nr:glycosyltransferase [Bacteroidota bacterium]
MTAKPVVFIFGKLPPPYMGPAIATEILLQSPLKNDFELIHIDTKTNTDLRQIGSWSFKKLIKNFKIYLYILRKGFALKPRLVLIPISQSTVGFFKDSLFILISRIICRKVLLHLRGSEFKIWMDRSNFITRLYVKSIFRLCAGVIVLGNNLRYLFKGYFPEKEIYVAANGGDYALPAPQKSENGKVNILYLGNLQSSKGIEDLIEAIKLLPQDVSQQINVDIIGGWRNEMTQKKCLDTCNTYQLPVTFHPPEKSPQKLQYMANADIFVFPPREPEGHPWVIVEAMAAGLPIISTDRGAIIESVEDGINGYIVPLADPKSLSEKLIELCTSPDKRKRMGLASRKKYESGFTLATMTINLKNIFNQVILK